MSYLKTAFSYILVFGMLTVFALFLDATAGVFVLIIFISAFVLSLVLHICAVKAFGCEISVDSDVAEKNDEIKLTAVTSKAAFFLPTVFEVELLPSYHLDSTDCVALDSNKYAFALGRKEKMQDFILKAKFFGKASVKINSVRALDILGIFAGRLSKKNKVFNGNSFDIKILPSIPDVSQNSELLRTLEESSAYDDNELSREIPFAMIGFPGYEHRDYVPGDPLKSVNWKLSAKRDRLLVRKPEAYAGGDQAVVLDCQAADIPSASNDNRKLAEKICEQTAVEAMLSLIRSLVKQEILCRVYVRFNQDSGEKESDGGWEIHTVQCIEDIEKLRYAFTDYKFYEKIEKSEKSQKIERIPDISEESASGFVIFSANPDKSLYSSVEPLRQKGITPEIASPVSGYANNWNISESDGEVVFSRG